MSYFRCSTSRLFSSRIMNLELPLVITRKRSWSADRMSRDLGFRILDIHKQFVLPVALMWPTKPSRSFTLSLALAT